MSKQASSSPGYGRGSFWKPFLYGAVRLLSVFSREKEAELENHWMFSKVLGVYRLAQASF